MKYLGGFLDIYVLQISQHNQNIQTDIINIYTSRRWFSFFETVHEATLLRSYQVTRGQPGNKTYNN